jgi:hypothetical protein
VRFVQGKAIDTIKFKDDGFDSARSSSEWMRGVLVIRRDPWWISHLPILQSIRPVLQR